MPRGRPRGSKNKPKVLSETASDIKILKRQIKDLRAEKLSLPSGNEKRIELYREIKRLRQILKDKKEFKETKTIEITQDNMAKEPIIAEILRIEAEQKTKPRFEDLGIDLHKFTAKELEHHLKRLKNGKDN